ncbi:MAG: hypothetical protein VXB01_00835 [Opitutae bacterium]
MKYLLLISLILVVFKAMTAADVPAVLPQPDQKPPSDGKVKVYILAGQSNMVGFGTLEGARPTYPSIYLSADPALKAGRMPVGNSALLPHGVYQTAEKNAPKGAKVMIYKGNYKEGRDYSKLKPVKASTLALGTVAEQLPSIEGPHTIVVKAYIDVPMSGKHQIHTGYDSSTYAVVRLGDEEVYRRDLEQDAMHTVVHLERGERYAISITYFKSGSAAWWL